MKGRKKVLALILALCMIFTVAPVTAEAAPEDQTAETDVNQADSGNAEESDENESGVTPLSDVEVSSKMLMLDAGRKYYSKDWIVALIHEMDAAGYTDLQLAVGNDGMRFYLDDMKIEANGTTYESENVKAALEAGNNSYNSRKSYTPEKNALTEDEMDEIIAAAKECGINIIPVLNSPGHMDTVLSAMGQLGITGASYNGSVTTIDLTNDQAVAFTKAFTQKYVAYFKAQGCTAFNFGADEYANDIYSTGGMGFGQLVNTSAYNNYVTYVNALTSMITSAGMTAMAFNDGIYYANSRTNASFDNELVICYWSPGWSGYEVASAALLAERGHQLINTNGTYYYVLGRENIFTTQDYTAAAGFDNTQFNGYDSKNPQGSQEYTISDPVGSMFCVWADFPASEDENTVAANIRLPLRAMAARMAGEPVGSIDTSVVAYGFNEDGTVNDGETTSPGEGENEGDSEVTEPVIPQTTEDVSLAIGGTDVKTQNGLDNELTAEDIRIEDSSVVDVQISSQEVTTGGETQTLLGNSTTSVTSGSQYVIASGNNALGINGTDLVNVNLGGTTEGTVVNDAAVWTITRSGSGYTISTEIDGRTYYLGYVQESDWNWGTTYTYTLALTTESSVWSYSNGRFSQRLISSSPMWGNDSYSNYYLRYNSNWQMSTTSSQVTLYTTTQQTTGPVETTFNHTITFTGLATGSTQVIIGNVAYNVTVSDNMLVENPSWTPKFRYFVANAHDVNIEQNGTHDGGSDTEANSKDAEAYTAGKSIEEMVAPAVYTQRENYSKYWKTYVQTNPQQEQGGQDLTDEGQEIGVQAVALRYQNDMWEYQTVSGEWETLSRNAQLTVYYVERTTVSDEINVYMSDWGSDPYDSANDQIWNWTNNQCISISFQTVYVDTGYRNPTDSNLRETTQFTGIGTQYSVIEVENTSNYEVVDVCLVAPEAGKCQFSGNSAATFTLPDFNNYEEISIYDAETGTVSAVPKTDIASTAWLVRIYVREIKQEDSLTIRYVDENANVQIHEATVNVNDGITFDDAVTGTGTTFGSLSAEELAAMTADEINASYIHNAADRDQNFNTDLNSIPSLDGKYTSGIYQYHYAELSEDGKTLTFYYNIDSSATTVNYVVDFGLPLEIDFADLVDNPTAVTGITASSRTTYGTVETTEDALIYTPNTVLKSADIITATVSYSSGDPVQILIYLYPATTVNYEEGFADFAGDGWNLTNSSTGTGTQTASKAGDKARYGYDDKYSEDSFGASNGSEAVSEAVKDTATFTFTGTGADIYANCDTDSGIVTVQIKNTDTNTYVKLLQIDTRTGEAGNATSGQAVASYGLPIASVTGLDYGNYEITVRHINREAGVLGGDIALDGFRIYGTVQNIDDRIYSQDNEADPSFAEVRNQVLTALAVNEQESQYYDEAVQEILNQVYNNAGTTAGAVVFANAGHYSTDTVQDLLDNGPKNELYLFPGEAVTFTLANGVTASQVGLKAVNSSVSYMINGEEGTLTTSEDMFYNSGTGEITITNISDADSGAILSLTKIKAFGNTEGSIFGAVTARNVQAVMMSLSLLSEEPTYADATANINLVDYSGKVIASTDLTASGEEGTDAVFTADSIRTAAEQILPSGYDFVDKDAVADQMVAYGGSTDVNVQIGKVATLNVTYKTLFGRTKGTVTLTAVQTSSSATHRFTAAELRAASPDNGYWTGTLISTSVKYGETVSRTVIGLGL